MGIRAVRSHFKNTKRGGDLIMKLLTLALAITLMAAFASLSTAQMKGEEKSPPKDVEMKQPGGERKGPTQGESSKCGTVTNINHKANTFTIIEATGKKTTFDASAMKTLPPLGDTVVVAYLPGSGDPLKGLNVSKSPK